MLRVVRVVTTSFVIIQSLILAYFLRPIQDDYFNLQSVKELGVLNYLVDTWNSHGGNMVQFLFHCILILPTTQSYVYWNLALFFLASQVLVFLAIQSILNWILPTLPSQIRIWIQILSLAGFEGIFVPGFLGSFGFSLATLAHLWPVIAFVFALLALKQTNFSWFISLSLGVIAGNSNLGESAFCLAACLLIFVASKNLTDFSVRSGIEVKCNFWFLSFGTLLGTLCIVIAPGFWDRASDQVGLPETFQDFLFRLIKSFVSFTVDGLTHPMVLLFFFLGMWITRSKPLVLNQNFMFRRKLLLIGFVLIWASLIVGSTFAYPAWHQSMGMYVLLLPSALVLGLTTKFIWLQRQLKILLALSSILMCAVFLRIGILGAERGLEWDRNLVLNSCLIQSGQSTNLRGAEIKYPPFGLGVEDINTWEWMRVKYVDWIRNMPKITSCR